MYEKYLEIFALSDVFSDYVKYLRENMQFNNKNASVSLMKKYYHLFPELTFEDWVNILVEWDKQYNPDPPEASAPVPLHECWDMDRILRKRLEKSASYWNDETDPIWHGLYHSRNFEKE